MFEITLTKCKEFNTCDAFCSVNCPKVFAKYLAIGYVVEHIRLSIDLRGMLGHCPDWLVGAPFEVN